MSVPRTTWGGEALTWQPVDGVLEVCLHRDPLNEIGLLVLRELEMLAQVVRSQPEGIHAILFHSAVERGFSAGADLRELQAGLHSVSNGGGAKAWADQARSLFVSPGQVGRALQSAMRIASTERLDLRRAAKVAGVRAFLDRIHSVFDTFDTASVPTIAAVHGVCFGGGFELALTCDLIVADKTARFAFPELRLGLIPGFGGIPRLERDLGNAIVRELLLSGRSLGAQRAHEVGLVGQLAGKGEALNIARRLAKQIGRFDRKTATVAKAFLKPFPRAELEREKELFCRLLTSDAVERALDKFVSAKDAMPYLP
ncbi:MAG: enoyl-CoA hydratase/isomerase family protein [Sandaracinaceae bacterium]|nr:enoyl-CoA hydratase/isomerase family protein [Sandaracinaceae bacterium]